MFWWRSLLAARASCRKRAAASPTSAACRCNTLIATLRPSSGCTPEYTTPMPPCPSSPVTSYSPTIDPASHATGMGDITLGTGAGASESSAERFASGHGPGA